MSSKVIFATKCWSEDWQKVLRGFDNKAELCQYPFDSKVLVLNNDVPVVDWPMDTIDAIADKEEILKFFQLQEANVYALGELAAIWATNPEWYICFVQGDVMTQGSWVEPGLKILDQHPEISVCSPASSVNTWHDEHGLDHYCSDQAFLIRAKEFRNPEVYRYSLNQSHDPNYPSYGQNSFEHMIGCYLKATGRYRKIIEEGYAQHPAY